MAPATLTVVDNRFVVAQQQVQLKLKERMFSWSGDTFDITEVASKKVWFLIKGQALSFRDKKTLYDGHGKDVAKMKNDSAWFASCITASGDGFRFDVRSASISWRVRVKWMHTFVVCWFSV